MNSRFLITRRLVLQQLATVLSAVAVSAPAYSNQGTSHGVSDSRLSVVIDELISNRASAAIIGESYLAQCEHERSADILSREIHASLGVETGEIHQQDLLNQIRVDFEHADIINLHGWLLSRTEARLCALCTF
jgi:hypothetical protein